MHPSKPDDNQFAVVYVTHIYEEAHIIVGRLQADDIASYIEREAIASALGLSAGRLGEIRVLVHQRDYELATHILHPDDDDLLELEHDNSDIIYHTNDAVDNDSVGNSPDDAEDSSI